MKRLVQLSKGKQLLASFIYFFSLMTTFFILRPVRDEMGIQAGVENMQWLFTGTFIAMLLIIPVFAWITKKYPRNTFIPASYIIFLIQILIFYIAFQSNNISRYISALFFIWLSVFNLFVVSVFWSLMSDLYDEEQAKVHYATIAAGGTLGALSGPAISAYTVSLVGTINLLLFAALFMLLATGAVLYLCKGTKSDQKPHYVAHSTNLWSALPLVLKSPRLTGIAIFILLYTSVSTFLYFQQATIVSGEFLNSDQRTAYFAWRDIGSNTLTLILQFFLTKEVLKRYGLIIGLSVIPLISLFIFFALGLSSHLYVLVVCQILYRGGNYAIQKPTREILYTEVSSEERYRGKNFIDTAVYRGGDALSGWLYSGLTYLGLGLSGIAFLAIPIAAIWMIVGRTIGRSTTRPTAELVGV